MKTLVLGDWHRDFWLDDSQDPLLADQSLLDSVDAIIFAGDISNKSSPRWRIAFEDLRKQFSGKVIAFPGNHDHYSCRFDREDKMIAICEKFDVDYGQCGSYQLGDTRVLTCTLWTDLELGGGVKHNDWLLPQRMNDYRVIRVEKGGYRRLSPTDTLMQHREHVSWLEKEMSAHQGKTAVITHHAPHPGGLMQADAELVAAYASDLSPLMEKYEPELWLHGHAHKSRSLKIHNTEIQNVSLGYPEKGMAPNERLWELIYDF